MSCSCNELAVITHFQSVGRKPKLLVTRGRAKQIFMVISCFHNHEGLIIYHCLLFLVCHIGKCGICLLNLKRKVLIEQTIRHDKITVSCSKARNNQFPRMETGAFHNVMQTHV